MSVLNNALKNVTNAERRGKRQVVVRPVSKVVVKFLQLMMKNGTFTHTHMPSPFDSRFRPFLCVL
jgi:ribosomal protein S8